MLELCGGEASEVVIAGAAPDWRRHYVLRAERPASLGGLDVPPAESAAILTALGCAVEKQPSGDLSVEPPSWRGDIEGEADLVEEVLRVKGYDHIPAVPLPREAPLPRPALVPARRRSELVRRTLAARGLTEAVGFSFISAREAELFGGAKPELRLVNPISADLDAMRPSLLPGLRRGDRAQRRSRLSRCGTVRIGAALSRRHARRASYWRRPDCAPARPAPSTGASRPHPSTSIRSRPTRWRRSRRWALRPRMCRSPANRPAGTTPAAPAFCGLGRWCWATSANCTRPLSKRSTHGRRSPGSRCFSTRCPSRAPAAPSRRCNCRCSSRSSAISPLSSTEAVPAETLLRAARGVDRKLVTEIRLFDVYQGAGLPAGKKSLAITVRLQPAEHTLTDAEIEGFSKRLVAQVEKATGGRLRE